MLTRLILRPRDSGLPATPAVDGIDGGDNQARDGRQGPAPHFVGAAATTVDGGHDQPPAGPGYTAPRPTPCRLRALVATISRMQDTSGAAAKRTSLDSIEATPVR
jgi:hypothetical protein